MPQQLCPALAISLALLGGLGGVAAAQPEEGELASSGSEPWDLVWFSDSLGFDVAGVARAEPTRETESLRGWLDRGFAGEMHYIGRRAEERVDPRLVLDGARSVVALGVVYDPGEPGIDSTDATTFEMSAGETREGIELAIRPGDRIETGDREGYDVRAWTAAAVASGAPDPPTAPRSDARGGSRSARNTFRLHNAVRYQDAGPRAL